jgi:hypothetical protein
MTLTFGPGSSSPGPYSCPYSLNVLENVFPEVRPAREPLVYSSTPACPKACISHAAWGRGILVRECYGYERS